MIQKDEQNESHIAKNSGNCNKTSGVVHKVIKKHRKGKVNKMNRKQN